MKNNSGPDRNDKLMKRAGFKRSEMDKSIHHRCGNTSFWINEYGLRVNTTKNEILSLRKLLMMVMNQSAFRTRKRIQEKLMQIEYGVTGFIYEKDQS